MSRPGQLADLAFLGGATLLLFTLWLGARDLWNPNEPTYGRAVVEMNARGDWMVPRVNEQVFAEKPILYFWLALVASRLTGGITEFSLRLPSAAAGVGAVLLVYLLVRSQAGRARALLAAGVLSTTYLVFWSARSVQMDLLVATWVLAAVFFATRVLEQRTTALRGGVACGAALGACLLAKGPVGVILSGLIVACYAVTTRRIGALCGWRFLLCALGGLVAVAAPWYTWLWARGETEFLFELLYRQNVERFFDPWDHRAPAWYYLETFWTDMAPWSLFLPLAWGLAPAGDGPRRLERLAWSWLAVVIVFFSLSASKRSPYLLPAAPAVAILVAAPLEAWIEGSLGRGRRRAALGIFATVALGMLGAAVLLLVRGGGYTRGDPRLVVALHGTVAVLFASGSALALILATARLRRIGAPLALFASLLALYLWAAGAILPAVDLYKSHRAFCAEIQRFADGHPLRGYGLWKWRASYSFYSGRSVQSLEGSENLRSYWREPGPVFLVVERGRLGEARSVLGDRAPLAQAEVGDNAAYLFSNEAVQPVGANHVEPIR